MQDALVQHETRAREVVRVAEVDEVPVTQRRLRRQRAPMCPRQHGERETETRVIAARIGLRGGAEMGEIGLQLDTRAEQHHVALEFGEPELRTQKIERGCGGGCGLHFFLAVAVVARDTLKQAAQPCELRVERLPIGLDPRGVGRSVHAGMFICCVGSNCGGVAARSINRLSAPSTRSRSQCGPAARDGKSNCSVPGGAGRSPGTSRPPTLRLTVWPGRSCGVNARLIVTTPVTALRAAADAPMSRRGASTNGRLLVLRSTVSPARRKTTVTFQRPGFQARCTTTTKNNKTTMCCSLALLPRLISIGATRRGCAKRTRTLLPSRLWPFKLTTSPCCAAICP